jgi:hypothetical protein
VPSVASSSAICRGSGSRPGRASSRQRVARALRPPGRLPSLAAMCSWPVAYRWSHHRGQHFLRPAPAEERGRQADPPLPPGPPISCSGSELRTPHLCPSSEMARVLLFPLQEARESDATHTASRHERSGELYGSVSSRGRPDLLGVRHPGAGLGSPPPIRRAGHGPTTSATAEIGWRMVKSDDRMWGSDPMHQETAEAEHGSELGAALDGGGGLS